MKRILPTIVISQFFCTSLWFAGNAALTSIGQKYQLDSSFLAHLTSAVQFGFITGTLLFAVFSVSDRFSPTRVFTSCAIIAAIINLAICISGLSTFQLLSIRFLTGFFLAGIYPVGMKIAADYYRDELSKSLGFLVGALVFGTALPHLLKGFTGLPWQSVILFTSVLSCTGGMAMLILVPDGPYRNRGQKFIWSAFLSAFKDQKFRSTAIGYFGHNWELYSFWVFLPIMLTNFHKRWPAVPINIPLFCFLIIASGGLACFCSGILSQRLGVKKTAVLSLSLSGLCCLTSPFFLTTDSLPVLLIFLFIWGMSVVADSPLFSTMIAHAAVPAFKGTSLTIVNCIGFALTIVSIQIVNLFDSVDNSNYVYLILAIGPAIGLFHLLRTRQ